MKYRIEYISTFYADVSSAVEFLEEYPDKAMRIFAKMDRAIKNLEKMPELYPVYRGMTSFRFIVIEDYLVFYNVKKANRIVEIHRLINGRMDITAHIQE